MLVPVQADLELVAHGYAANESDAAHKALAAGVDMSMQSGLYRQYVPRLVRDGLLPERLLDQASARTKRQHHQRTTSASTN